MNIVALWVLPTIGFLAACGGSGLTERPESLQSTNMVQNSFLFPGVTEGELCQLHEGKMTELVGLPIRKRDVDSSSLSIALKQRGIKSGTCTEVRNKNKPAITKDEKLAKAVETCEAMAENMVHENKISIADKQIAANECMTILGW